MSNPAGLPDLATFTMVARGDFGGFTSTRIGAADMQSAAKVSTTDLHACWRCMLLCWAT